MLTLLVSNVGQRKKPQHFTLLREVKSILRSARSSNVKSVERLNLSVLLFFFNNWFYFFFERARWRILQSNWFLTRSVFSYLCPRTTVTLSWVAKYVPTFVAIFHKYISFFRLGSIFKQTRRSLPQADEWLMNPLFSFTQITLVDRKILVSEWICINNSVITLVDKRPKTRLQLILIVHKKYQES